MPRIDIADLSLHYEESGMGTPILVVIESAGHMTNMERPETFNRAMQEFLSTL